MKYYNDGNIDKTSGALSDVVLRIQMMGDQYHDYADQFEEIWRDEVIPSMGKCP